MFGFAEAFFLDWAVLFQHTNKSVDYKRIVFLSFKVHPNITAMASQITGDMIVNLNVCSGADQRKLRSSASLGFVRGTHWWSVNSPHKGPVTGDLGDIGSYLASKSGRLDGRILTHYSDAIMGAMASQITSLMIVYSIADQRKHQSPASLAFLRGIHRSPVNSAHKWPVTRKMFPFDDVIMQIETWNIPSGVERHAP